MTPKARREIVQCLRLGAVQSRKDAEAAAVSVRDIHLRAAEYREWLANQIEAAGRDENHGNMTPR